MYQVLISYWSQMSIRRLKKYSYDINDSVIFNSGPILMSTVHYFSVSSNRNYENVRDRRARVNYLKMDFIIGGICFSSCHGIEKEF